MTIGNPHAHAARLLAARPEGLEPGLHVLDEDLELADGCRVDLLACDGLGDPLVVLFCERDLAPALARCATITSALRAGRPLLRRLYASQGLDVDRAPRFALLSPRIADEGAGLLELLGRGDVDAWEYRVVRTPEGTSLLDLALFARSSAPVAVSTPAPSTASAPAPAPSSPSATSSVGEMPPANGNGHAAASGGLPVAAGEAQALFDRARESIRALSGEVRESDEADRRVFRVQASPLASLRQAGGSVYLRVGDDESEQALADEASFNAGLNAVFSHYFDRIAHRA